MLEVLQVETPVIQGDHGIGWVRMQNRDRYFVFLAKTADVRIDQDYIIREITLKKLPPPEN